MDLGVYGRKVEETMRIVEKDLAEEYARNGMADDLIQRWQSLVEAIVWLASSEVVHGKED